MSDAERIAKVESQQDQLWAHMRDHLEDIARVGKQGIQSEDDAELARGVCLTVAGLLYLNRAKEDNDG